METQERGLASWQEVTFAKDKPIALAAGVEVLNFSPADTERYIDLAYSSYWADIIKKYPDTGQRFFEMMEE